jgi:hypothetical protein
MHIYFSGIKMCFVQTSLSRSRMKGAFLINKSVTEPRRIICLIFHGLSVDIAPFLFWSTRICKQLKDLHVRVYVIIDTSFFFGEHMY